MNFDLSFDKIKNKKLDAVVLVNLNGRNAKFDNKIKVNSLNLIEDCAQSFLSFRDRNKLPNKVVSCYSTGATKLLNTFQGGFALPIILIFIKKFYFLEIMGFMIILQIVGSLQDTF